MSSTWRVRWRVRSLLVVLAAGLVALSGCIGEIKDVAVAGYDTNGTLVVGTASCGAASGEYDSHPDLAIQVAHVEGARSTEIWAIEGRQYGSPQPSVVPGPAPPGVRPPDPRAIAEVRFDPVGDPELDGVETSRITVVALAAPLPRTGTFEVMVEQDPPLELSAEPGRDRYVASLDGDIVRDVSEAELTEQIDELCEPDPLDVGGPLGVLLVVGTVVLVLGAAALVVAVVVIGALVVRAIALRTRPPTRRW